MVQKVQFERPADALDLLPHIEYAASLNLRHCEKDRHKGEPCLIVSTGPTIANKTVFRQIKKLAETHSVIALKESAAYLRARGVDPKYSVSMDPGSDRQITRTPPDPDITYCVASSCHPKFFDHLINAGCEVNVFHSACGQGAPTFEKGMLVDAGMDTQAVVEGEYVITTMNEGHEFCPVVPFVKSEIEIYGELFDGYADVMCGGFTVTNRALALAKYMGFDPIVMAATDFGWRKKGGSHYCPEIVKVATHDDQYMTDHGDVDGTTWFTKPDQLASATDVAKKIKAGEVTVLGDTLPGALAKRDDDYLEQIVQMK